MKDYQLQTVDYVVKMLLDQFGFTLPERIDLEILCDFLGFKFKYIPGDLSMGRRKNGKIKIFVANDVDRFEQRRQFAHEIGHFIRHDGMQLAATDEYVQYLDNQADIFAERLLVPTHLLAQLTLPPEMNQAVKMVAVTFDVSKDLARKRITEYFSYLMTLDNCQQLQDILDKRFLLSYLGYYWVHDNDDQNIVHVYREGKGFIRKIYVEGCYS